jgi:hypothetical protein
VAIIRYVTEGSFDTFMYQILRTWRFVKLSIGRGAGYRWGPIMRRRDRMFDCQSDRATREPRSRLCQPRRLATREG